MKRSIKTQTDDRRGAALVEFAVVLPVILTLIFGTIEIGRSMQASTILNAAVREGGRLASMDFAENVGDGETANAKVERDIKNFISASGLPGHHATVTITKVGAGVDGQLFNLEDSSNNLQMFRISVTLKQSHVSIMPLAYLQGKDLGARAVFRAVRSSLAS